MSGELRIDGHPAAKAKIVRHYRSEWYDSEKDVVTYTDNKGQFKFSGVWRAAAVQLVHQPVVFIEVTVEHEGRSIKLLDVTKMDYSKFGELDKYAPNRGVARLSQKEDRVYLDADILSDPK